MLDQLPTVSFIIPAKNEEAMLPTTLDNIRNVVGNNFAYEIIVIDNDSSDSTVTLARSKGARVLSQKKGNIGGLRNTAVEQARGLYLVFLDADVSLTESWLEPFLDVLESLRENPNIITGSRCSTTQTAGWIANSWFRRPPAIHQTTHIGSGHMLTSKQLFNQIGGFDDKLHSGEDFDFCARAKRNGAAVLENQKLKVIHYGVPRTIGEFIRREIWHGSGDVHNIKTLIKSKVAVLSLFFLAAHIGLLSSLTFFPESWLLLLISLSTLITIIFVSTFKKYSYAPMTVILKNIVLYYFYFWGRSISLINRVFPVISTSSPRTGRL